MLLHKRLLSESDLFLRCTINVLFIMERVENFNYLLVFLISDFQEVWTGEMHV